MLLSLETGVGFNGNLLKDRYQQAIIKASF
jgi:hypothetical protein